MYIMAGCAAAGTVFAIFLRETAPAKLQPQLSGGL
jgi:hypothetical protein